MNKFKKKILLGLGAVTAVVAPVAAVIACSTTETYVQQTTGYTDSITKVQNGTLDFAGGYNDLRAFLSSTEKAKQVAIVGVESQRISNDGLQVDYKMNSGDQHALQVLFQIMVQDPNITATFSNETQQVFQMYSHSGYTIPGANEKISYVDGENVKEHKAYNGTLPKSSPEGNYFAKANQSLPAEKIDFTSIYENFKAKTGGNKINIAMIPSKDPAALTTVVKKLNEFVNSKHLPIKFTATTDYNAAATALGTTYQGAYLPVGTWGKLAANKSNFILKASRETTLAVLKYDAVNKTLEKQGSKFVNELSVVKRADRFGSLYLKDLPKTESELNETWVKAGSNEFKQMWRAEFLKVFNDDKDPLYDFVKTALAARAAKDDNDEIYYSGNYESFIYAKRNSSFTKKINEARSKSSDGTFAIKLSDLTKFTYGRTSPTSAASSTYPELWFNEHIYVSEPGDFSFASLK